MTASDASCSYPNGGTTKKNVKDGEVGVFGAEKYFKGVKDEETLTTSNNGINRYHPNQPQDQHKGVPCRLVKSKTVSSVRSDSSWNSRRGLLGSNGNNQSKNTSFKRWLASLACNCNNRKVKVKQPVKDGDLGQKGSFRSLLANLGCNCNHKDSVKILEVKQPVKSGDSGQKLRSLSSRWAFEDVNLKKEDCFSFPVLNTSMTDTKRTKSPEAEEEQKAEVLESSRNTGRIDMGSDASSDLFELESFTTNEDNLFLARQVTESNNGYAPSEASVDWSVVTDRVSDVSASLDLTVSCTKQKAFNDEKVSGDEDGVISGGDKSVSSTRREWCHRLDSATPTAKIQADNRLIGGGSDLRRSQIARSVNQMISAHASNHSKRNGNT